MCEYPNCFSVAHFNTFLSQLWNSHSDYVFAEMDSDVVGLRCRVSSLAIFQMFWIHFIAVFSRLLQQTTEFYREELYLPVTHTHTHTYIV